MRKIALSALVCLTAFACGGGSSSPGGDDDVPADGPGNTPTPDGPVTNPQASPLGTTCTPDQANPQGSCPTGFQCLSLEGGTNAWCSKTCTGPTDTSCETGYDGPGKAACTFQITPMGGGAAQTFCAVICQDMTQNNQICPTTQCDGTCPGTLACTAPLMTQGNNPMTVANACE